MNPKNDREETVTMERIAQPYIYIQDRISRTAAILEVRDAFVNAGDLAGLLAWAVALSEEDGELLMDGLRARGEI